MSEVYIARLAVAVFGDDGYPQPLCRISALLVRCQVCQCRAIEQNHQVGILLDGAACGGETEPRPGLSGASVSIIRSL